MRQPQGGLPGVDLEAALLVRVPVYGLTINAARDRNSEPCTAKEISALRSVIGSLSWIARQGRPDLSYRVSRLQTMVKGATLGTLTEANKVVDLAIGGLDVCIRYSTGMCDFNDLGVLTVTDASLAGEPGMKSQQGRMHFLCPSSQVRDPKCEQLTVLPISFASTTIKRVCRATLQAEAYSLKPGVEA